MSRKKKNRDMLITHGIEVDNQIIDILSREIKEEIDEDVYNIISSEFNEIPQIRIPSVRRIYPELISADVMGIQPMSEPVGIKFIYFEKTRIGHDDERIILPPNYFPPKE